MTKCSAIDRNLKGCRCNAINDTSFCKKHDYMVDYTEEMLSNLQICSGCKKSYYIPDGKTCSSCRNRGKQNKQTARENVVLCANDKCVFKRSDENKYCQKHQLCIFVDDTVDMGKKICKNYVRGCRSQLDLDYQYVRCQSCLERERERERNRRSNTKSTTNTDTHQTCSTCCQELENSLFVGVNGGNTKTCKNCRDSNHIQDQKRDKEHRNELSRVAEQKPERKEVKQQWNENNYEKVVMKSMNYRQRQIETDIEGYLNKNAENAKQWRENNPEKNKENNKSRLENIKIHYSNYSRTANNKNLDFELTNEDFDKIVKNPCYYCGTIQDKGFNGIDRKNSEIGYIEGNCVSCCKMCNYMKGSLSEDAFLGRIEHVLTYNGKIEGGLFPEMFADYNGGACRYTQYKKRAHKKNLDFMLSQDMFNKLICNRCYICGKKSSPDHINGIDRIDNNLGYTLDNGKACCGGCNYMKRNYSLEDVFDKYQNIHTYNIMQRIVTNKIVEQPLNDIIEQVDAVAIANDAVLDDIPPKKSKLEKNRESQRRYREKFINEQGIEVLREKEREKKRNQVKTDNIAKKNKKTDEEKREDTRQRKQKQRLKENETKTISGANDMVTNKNKKTDDEIREDARIRKQQQRLRLQEKYADEEYKKVRSRELADNRKNNQK